jgi:predicted transcriptional regulator
MRIAREAVLERKVRRVMYEFIRDHPGSSFSAVRDALGLKNGVAAYHLTVLERFGLVHSESRRHHRWYYPNGDVSLWKNHPLSSLQMTVIDAVQRQPGIGIRELARTVSRRPSSVLYNVNALADENVLRRERADRKVRCFSSEEERPAESPGSASG